MFYFITKYAHTDTQIAQMKHQETILTFSSSNIIYSVPFDVIFGTIVKH